MAVPEYTNKLGRCFKAYDIRGQIPEDLNEDVAWRFNLGCSNTEPLLRLNVEFMGDLNSLSRQVSIIEKLIKNKNQQTELILLSN